MAKKKKTSTRRRPPPPKRTSATQMKPSGPLSAFSPRERREIEQVFEMVLEGAPFALVDARPPLEVQAWASGVCGIWYGRRLLDRDVEQVFAAGLVDYVVRKRPGSAVRVLRALASVFPEPHASVARDRADELVNAGASEPEWSEALQAPGTATRALMLTEPVDDDAFTIIAELTGPLGTLSMGANIHRNVGGLLKDAFVNPQPLSEVEAKLRETMAATDGLSIELAEISLPEARTRIEEALFVTDRTIEPPITDDARSARAFIAARLRDLPDPIELPQTELSQSDRDALLEEFAESAPAQQLGLEPDKAADLAHFMLWYSSDYAGGTPLRFSPEMVELFCTDFAPRKVVGDESDFRALPDVLRAWIRFAGQRRGIPSERIDEAVAAVSRYEDKLVIAALDRKSWGPAKAIVQAAQERGIDPADGAAMQTLIDDVNTGKVDIGLNPGLERSD